MVTAGVWAYWVNKQKHIGSDHTQFTVQVETSGYAVTVNLWLFVKGQAENIPYWFCVSLLYPLPGHCLCFSRVYDATAQPLKWPRSLQKSSADLVFLNLHLPTLPTLPCLPAYLPATHTARSPAI